MSGDNLLRINQINAIFLDNEIYKTLLQIIHDTTKYLPVSYHKYTLCLLISLFLYFLAWFYSTI